MSCDFDSDDVVDALASVSDWKGGDICIECGMQQGTSLHQPAADCDVLCARAEDHHEFKSRAEAISLFLHQRIEMRASHE